MFIVLGYPKLNYWLAFWKFLTGSFHLAKQARLAKITNLDQLCIFVSNIATFVEVETEGSRTHDSKLSFAKSNMI